MVEVWRVKSTDFQVTFGNRYEPGCNITTTARVITAGVDTFHQMLFSCRLMRRDVLWCGQKLWPFVTASGETH